MEPRASVPSTHSRHYGIYGPTAVICMPRSQPESEVSSPGFNDLYRRAYEACKGQIPDNLDSDQKANFTSEVAQKILHVTGMVGKYRGGVNGMERIDEELIL